MYILSFYKSVPTSKAYTVYIFSIKGSTNSRAHLNSKNTSKRKNKHENLMLSTRSKEQNAF